MAESTESAAMRAKRDAMLELLTFLVETGGERSCGPELTRFLKALEAPDG